jgi:hypothetical protein
MTWQHDGPCAGFLFHCYSRASDRTAAYPASDPVSPADIVATIFHALGIDHRAQVSDQQGRPFAVGTGDPILSLLG